MFNTNKSLKMDVETLELPRMHLFAGRREKLSTVLVWPSKVAVQNIWHLTYTYSGT